MNRLRDANIHYRRAASKEVLTEGQAVDRLAFATGWRDFDWGRVIFTDKHPSLPIVNYVDTFIVSQAPDMTQDISNDVRFREDLAYHAGLGWMSRAGVGVLERIHGRFNAPQYVHILENVMLPSVRIWNPDGN